MGKQMEASGQVSQESKEAAVSFRAGIEGSAQGRCHGHSPPRALISKAVQHSKQQLSTLFMPDLFSLILTEG